MGIEPLTSWSWVWVLNHQATPNTWEGQVQYSDLFLPESLKCKLSVY